MPPDPSMIWYVGEMKHGVASNAPLLTPDKRSISVRASAFPYRGRSFASVSTTAAMPLRPDRRYPQARSFSVSSLTPLSRQDKWYDSQAQPNSTTTRQSLAL